MTTYRGTEGTRPYDGAGWYYAEYRDHVSTAFITLLGKQLGWSPNDRILDLGAGPGQLSLLVAPYVAEVVAIEPEADMLGEGKRRSRVYGTTNLQFVAGSSDDLQRLRPSLGTFRTVLMGQSFHWMLEKDRVLQDLSTMIDETDGSVAFVKPHRRVVPDVLKDAQQTVATILERYLADTPPGPHPNGRHDPFEEILMRSPFPRIETLEHVYTTPLRPTIEALIGVEYTMSHVLTRLGSRREAFEQDVHKALSHVDQIGEVWITRCDEALIGRRQPPSAS